MAIQVNVDNFARAETDRMFGDLQRDAGGVNVLSHSREPAPVDHQTVIRMNRDTLYSFAVVDITESAVTAIHYDPGEHRLSPDRHKTPYVAVAVRILVDPTDPADVAAVTDIQDGFRLTAGSAAPFTAPEYDTTSLDETRDALLTLARGLTSFHRTFGTRDEVDPVRHLIGTAAGWGGLPTHEAIYVGVTPTLPPGDYELTVRDVPVDGFWSISVYNARGFFEPNERGVYTVNGVTGVPNDDGSVTVRFSSDGDASRPNTIPTPEGWNYVVRLYRPRAEILDGSWTFPAISG